MRKQVILYIAVDYKDADYFLTELFDKDGKKDSCVLNIHPDVANDQFVREKLSECVDYIRDNYDMEIFTKI